MLGSDDRLLPFFHFPLQLVFQRLVFLVEFWSLGSTGGEDFVARGNLCLKRLYLLFFLLDNILQLAPLALTFLRLLVGLLGGGGGFLSILNTRITQSALIILRNLQELHDVPLELVHGAVAKLEQLVGEAVVTQGGIAIGEVNPKSMESRLVKGLYLVGELLDLDADTGGYNLQIAFSTGHAAGEAV